MLFGSLAVFRAAFTAVLDGTVLRCTFPTVFCFPSDARKLPSARGPQ
jgi:hypothetical protein